MKRILPLLLACTALFVNGESLRAEKGSPLKMLMVVHEFPTNRDYFIYEQTTHLFDHKVSLKILPTYMTSTGIPSDAPVGQYADLFKPVDSHNDVDFKGLNLIYCQYPDAAIRMVPVAKRRGFLGKVAVAYNSAKLSELATPRKELNSVLNNSCDLHIVPSRALANQLIDLGAPFEKVVVLRNGIDLSGYPYREKTIQAGKTVKMLSVGNFDSSMSHDTTIKAMRVIVDAFPNVQLKIIGSGPKADYLLELVRSNGLDKHIKIETDTSEKVLKASFANSHIFISPSGGAKESFVKSAIIKAMACGLPVIATPEAQGVELFTNQKSGWLVAERDECSLADMVLSLTDPEDSRSFSATCEAARDRALLEFDSAAVNERLYALFENLLQR